jgi:hypothetical protein
MLAARSTLRILPFPAGIFVRAADDDGALAPIRVLRSGDGDVY